LQIFSLKASFGWELFTLFWQPVVKGCQAGARIIDPQIPSLMPWQCATATMLKVFNAFIYCAGLTHSKLTHDYDSLNRVFILKKLEFFSVLTEWHVIRLSVTSNSSLSFKLRELKFFT